MEFEKHPTLIVIGETGCGKTTQIPQYLHELNMEGDGKIGITQPRRVAAVTIASRVAAETKSNLGQKVGYSVRFEDVTSSNTKIKYLTDGMLLREAMSDELLSGYNIVLLDEAHERTVHTDVLFGIVKQAQKARASHSSLQPLKIVIMSATMDVDHFSKYFNNAPVVYLEGRQYPVTVKHACEAQEDYVHSCLVTLFQIHKQAVVNHHILVFLTGQEEIEAMTANIRSITKDPSFSYPPIRVHPLYAALSPNKQLDVFQPGNPNARKVILSTNIAETSVTIPGIKYVIDSGMVKQKFHHPTTGLDMLKVHSISQAQAWQRSGRAGRESEGFCYRAYTKAEFDCMIPNPVPEIMRTNLAGVVLQLLALNINLLTFDLLDKPSTELILEGVEQLKFLGAVDEGDEPVLTDLGKQMALFPLDPRFTKVILSASEFGCIDEVVTIIAFLSGESVFINNLAKKEEAAAAKAKFASSEGDHLTLLNVYKGFNSIGTAKYKFCYDNFLNIRNMEYAIKVRQQLMEICQRCKIPFSSCGDDTEKVRKCFVMGFFMNVAELHRDKKYWTLLKKQVVNIHPSSVVSGSMPPLVLYTELVRTAKTYMRFVMPIEQEWLDTLAPENIRNLSGILDVD
uniref:RNA helicase n=1 Tax=Lygus hesperus TaxID=30085 RepID=A0A0K8S6A6_LYGHE